MGYKVQISSVTLDITIHIKEEMQGHMTLKNKNSTKNDSKTSEEIKIKEKSCSPNPPTNINSRILNELFRGWVLEPHCSNNVVIRQGSVAGVQGMQSQEFISS